MVFNASAEKEEFSISTPSALRTVIPVLNSRRSKLSFSPARASFGNNMKRKNKMINLKYEINEIIANQIKDNYIDLLINNNIVRVNIWSHISNLIWFDCNSVKNNIYY